LSGVLFLVVFVSYSTFKFLQVFEDEILKYFEYIFKVMYSHIVLFLR